MKKSKILSLTATAVAAINALTATVALAATIVLTTIPAGASQANDKVQQIRQAYAEAIEMTKIDEPLARTEMKINVSRNVPAIGLQTKKIEFFGTSDYDKNGDMVYKVRFIRISYNVAARKFYEEYLYDDKGTPLFCYIKGEDYFAETATKFEKRYYFDKKSLCSYSFKAKDAETGETLQEKNIPELFEINNGQDYPDRLKEFGNWNVVFDSVMNHD